MCFALLGGGTETTVATSGGHTFQITGTSVGGKVVTTKLPLPANSKIVTVNVPTSQGGTAGFNKSHLEGSRRALNTFMQCRHFFFPSTTNFGMHVCLCFHYFASDPTAETFETCQRSQIRSGSLIGYHCKQVSGQPHAQRFRRTNFK